MDNHLPGEVVDAITELARRLHSDHLNFQLDNLKNLQVVVNAALIILEDIKHAK